MEVDRIGAKDEVVDFRNLNQLIHKKIILQDMLVIQEVAVKKHFYLTEGHYRPSDYLYYFFVTNASHSSMFT